MALNSKQWRKRILDWYDLHGRKDLPWANPREPYRVWVSEIMLQQTQVVTVIPYFQRFMQRFPSVKKLAAAPLDDVLHLWSGLGYYARARNLHRAAQIITENHQGKLPTEVDALTQLPGIGRSTAGAILSLSLDQAHPVLDGNVKRVLSRFYAVDGWPGQSSVSERLWACATQTVAKERAGDYTQAMMDLGAQVCTRSKPKCGECPITSHCRAKQLDDIASYPGKKPKRIMPVRETVFVLLYNKQTGEVLLQKRPPVGIWGGLWCFPECATVDKVDEWLHHYLGYTLASTQIQQWQGFRHTFSHYHLEINPYLAIIEKMPSRIEDANNTIWYDTQKPSQHGLSAPVKRLLSQLTTIGVTL